jgi:hypothetical protein
MPISPASLPADVQKYLKQDTAGEDGAFPSDEVLKAIGLSIAKLRDEAKEARVNSGIEDRWRDAEEAYAGIDDANRGEIGSGAWTKGMTSTAPITEDTVPDTNNRSTLYVRLTQRYVDAGTAKLGEILLSPGAKSFSLSATPEPDLINAKDDNRPVRLDHVPGAPLAMRPPNPGEVAGNVVSFPSPIAAPGTSPPGAPPVPAPAGGAVSPPVGAAGSPGIGDNGGPPLVPATVADFAKEKMNRADDAAKKAEDRIYDWHVECRRTSQVRKVIFDSGRLGVGILKGPFPKQAKQIATRKGPEGIELGIRQTITPASKWVNPWNFYPDPTCGEDIQDGDHCFEREWAGERQVRKLKAMPGYIGAQIDKVLAEGPQKANVKEGTTPAPAREDGVDSKKGKYEIWYFQGTLTREEMGCICEATGPAAVKKFGARVPPERQQVNATVTMINDSVVKATVDPLDSGEFIYSTMPWQRRVGSWAGVGIAEQIATPQKMLTAAVRSMLDNAGISAGGQIVIDTSVITPADGEMGMSPHKIWYLNGDGERLNVNEAFGLFRIDNVTAELMQIVELAMRLGEESTSIPLITQGQSGPTTPDTYGAAQLQNNNANQLLRSIGYTFDDHVTEPETRRYYEWLILDPDVPDDEKGDWTIDAHGSSALVERALQDQFLAQLGPLVLNPAYKLSPAKWAEMVVRSKQLNPKDLQYTEEEQARIDAQGTPPAPQVQAAQIGADSRIKAAQIVAGVKTAADQLDAHTKSDIATATLHADVNRDHLNYNLALLEYANKRGISLNEVKAELAKTAMTLQAQERLNARDSRQPRKNLRPQRTPRQVAAPAVEPKGRAPAGQAFER